MPRASRRRLGLLHAPPGARRDVLWAVAEALIDAQPDPVFARRDAPVHAISTSGIELDAEQADILPGAERALERIAGQRLGRDVERPVVGGLDEVLAADEDGSIERTSEDAHHSLSLVDGLPAWGVTLVTLAAVATVILAGRYLSPLVFRVIHNAKLKELYTVAALAFVVGIAVLMILVGLSPALGAFLAGVVLANSEFKHELEADIEPFKGLLLGLFFITVGAGINFGTLFGNPFLIAGHFDRTFPILKSVSGPSVIVQSIDLQVEITNGESPTCWRGRIF